MEWLTRKDLEQRSVEGIVESFEQFLAPRDLVHRGPAALPAVVFVDLSGYTRSRRSAETTWPFRWQPAAVRRAVPQTVRAFTAASLLAVPWPGDPRSPRSGRSQSDRVSPAGIPGAHARGRDNAPRSALLSHA
jgi:hypothetical protein